MKTEKEKSFQFSAEFTRINFGNFPSFNVESCLLFVRFWLLGWRNVKNENVWDFSRIFNEIFWRVRWNLCGISRIHHYILTKCMHNIIEHVKIYDFSNFLQFQFSIHPFYRAAQRARIKIAPTWAPFPVNPKTHTPNGFAGNNILNLRLTFTHWQRNANHGESRKKSSEWREKSWLIKRMKCSVHRRLHKSCWAQKKHETERWVCEGRNNAKKSSTERQICMHGSTPEAQWMRRQRSGWIANQKQQNCTN